MSKAGEVAPQAASVAPGGSGEPCHDAAYDVGSGLYVGRVFQVSLRNANVRAKSVKGGWKYEVVAEMAAEDFELFNGHDLTGSCFEAQIECTEIAQMPLVDPTVRQSAEVHVPGQFGEQAKVLKLSGFFRMPEVWAAIGDDADYLAWLRTLSCARCKKMPAEAAHVRRIAEGAGTGIKPRYSAIPLCRGHHADQHQHGESALGGREWCDRKRIQYVSEWGWQKLKLALGASSMADASPPDVLAWANLRGVGQYLPDAYAAPERWSCRYLPNEQPDPPGALGVQVPSA